MSAIRPHSEHDVADAVRAAAADRRHLDILGHGSKRGLGRKADADTVLDLSALDGILRYEPDEMVVTARAGTPVAAIEAVAAERHQCLGFAPADWGPLYGAPAQTATIGGVLSADASGPARLRNGAARDHLLGFRAVNGLGGLYRAGGRVVKNVTGFDVPKLFCGAFGTLGPMVEVTLRLLPRPPRAATLLLADIDEDAGLALLRKAWASPLEPGSLAYVPRGVLAALGDVGRGACLFRLDGAATPLIDKIAALTGLLGAGDLVVRDDGDALFASIGDGAAFLDSTADLWRLFVPPSSSFAALDMAKPSRWLADWAGGVIWLESDGDIHAVARRFGGHAMRMRGNGTAAVLDTQPAALAALAQRTKEAFDPHRLFNRGRLREGG